MGRRWWTGPGLGPGLGRAGPSIFDMMGRGPFLEDGRTGACAYADVIFLR